MVEIHGRTVSLKDVSCKALLQIEIKRKDNKHKHFNEYDLFIHTCHWSPKIGMIET